MAQTAAQAAALLVQQQAIAAGAALIAALSPLQRLLHTNCGLTQAQYTAMAADGYVDLMDFENMQWTSVEKWISATRKSTLNRGGFSVSAAREKRIQALVFWINDQLRTGRATVEADFDEAEFNATTMADMVDEAYIYHLDCNTDSDVSTPEKFAYNK